MGGEYIMKTRTFLQKLKSTKLWCAIAGIAVGAAIALGVDSNTIQTVAGAVTSVAALVTYIVTEGKIDAAAVGKTVQAVEDAVNAVKNEGSGGTATATADTTAGTGGTAA
jgi:hypothetical protein